MQLTKFTVFILLKCEPASVSPAAGLHRFPAVHFSFLPPSRLLHARPTPSGTNVVSSGRSPSRAVAAQAARSTVWQRKTASCGEERRPHDPGRHWGDVAILNRGFTGAQSGPGSSIGYASSVRRFCIYVAPLGQVHSFIDSAPSIYLSSEEERKKPQHILDQEHGDFLFMRKKVFCKLFYRELNEN